MQDNISNTSSGSDQSPKGIMDIIFAFVLLLCGANVYSDPPEVADQKVLVNKPKANSYGSPPVAIHMFSVLKGQCGCFDFSGDTLVYKPADMCDSILLCRMFHNIAIMHTLHFKKFGKFLSSSPVQSEPPNMNPMEYSLGKDDNMDFKNINRSCLSEVLQKDIPSLRLKLQNLLCLFQQGKEANNEALYKEFLTQLNIVLKDVGCSLDDVLKTKNDLEQTTDSAGKIADQLVIEILKTADDLEITGQLFNVGCKLEGKTRFSLSGILGTIVSGVKKAASLLLG